VPLFDPEERVDLCCEDVSEVLVWLDVEIHACSCCVDTEHDGIVPKLVDDNSLNSKSLHHIQDTELCEVVEEIHF
jgi:hypothetical protein